LDVPRPVETAGRIDGAETVFVVEDEAPLRGLIRSTLEPYGYRVLEAPDGGAALVLLDRAPERVDLLLTDIVMPRMSGIELAGHLRVSQPGLCVLFMSGYSEGPPDAEAAIVEGVPFLQKPFAPETLVRKIREILDNARSAPGRPGPS
ncbi:MAG: response regulator, partial [Bryobacteraceae bacterium]